MRSYGPRRRTHVPTAAAVAAALMALVLLAQGADAFAPPVARRPLRLSPSSSIFVPPPTVGTTTTELTAKRKKKKNRASTSSAVGEGFGKSAPTAVEEAPRRSGGDNDDDATATGLRSFEGSGFVPPPAAAAKMNPATGASLSEQLNIDPNLAPEEKSRAILRQKFGLKSMEEQQFNIDRGEAESRERKLAKSQDRKNRMLNIEELWPEGKDVFEVLPAPLLIGIGNFLKLGLVLTTVVFVFAGFGIAWEAFSVSTGNPLPDGVDEFISNIVEPYFTPLLGVLLGFSVSLGLFSTAQLSSASSTYKEQP